MRKLSILALLLALPLFAVAQQAEQKQDPANVQIINGPVVENVDADSAQVAWSTNVNSSTVVKYGTDPSKLDQKVFDLSFDTVKPAIVPVVLGAGRPFLPGPAIQRYLTLTGHRLYPSGIVWLEYRVQPPRRTRSRARKSRS